MKLAIMQPYLFPYIGYFQLISAVDVFVCYDDVQYIKNGWINRNRYLVNSAPHTFTFSVSKASTFLRINEREFAENHSYEVKKFLKLIHGSYGSAPYYKAVWPLLNEILSIEEANVARKIHHSLRRILDYLGVNTRIEESSRLNIGTQLFGQERVIAICRALGCKHYINAIGGRNLYSKDVFTSHNIELSFLETSLITYPQFGVEFVPNLSIVDVMMFNSVPSIHKLLDAYRLI